MQWINFVLFYFSLPSIFSVVESQQQPTNCLSNRLYANGSDFKYNFVGQFTHDMCAQCYNYIIVSGFKPEAFLRGRVGRNGTERSFRPFTYFQTNSSGQLCKYSGTAVAPLTDCVQPNPQRFNRTHPEADPVLSTFSSSFYMSVFIKCCEDAVKCCNETLSSLVKPSDGDFCPAKWDAWDCWPYTRAGTTARRSCPLSSLQSHNRELPECLRGTAEKKCTEAGKWYRVESGQSVREETNYVYCSFVGRQKSMREVQLRVALNIISLLFVVTSCVIFVGYRMYRVVRIRVHLNFFVSLVLTCVSDILFYLLIRRRHFQPSDNVLISNANWCVFLTVFIKFAKLTNYCWMLCEGIYLHKLIVNAFHEQTRTIHFYLVGWALPVIAMIPYVIVHKLKAYDEKCWIESMGNLEWIHYPLPMLCLIVNCVLLGNIIRVLYTKLRASPNPDHFKAALRATVFLIPVFGVHYIFYVTKGPRLQETCDAFLNFLFYLSIAVDCLQGALVATTFCILNAEVHSSIRKTIRRRFKAPEIVTEEHDLGRTVSSYASQRNSLANAVIHTTSLNHVSHPPRVQ